MATTLSVGHAHYDREGGPSGDPVLGAFGNFSWLERATDKFVPLATSN
jgi:hypothetical protein